MFFHACRHARQFGPLCASHKGPPVTSGTLIATQEHDSDCRCLGQQEGLRKLSSDGMPLMQLSPDEFHAITCSPYGVFCNEDGEILFEHFNKLMRHQLVMYVQRQLALGSEHEETRSTTFSTF